MPRSLHRVVLDDSSDISMVSLQSGIDSSANSPTKPTDSINHGVSSDCKIEQSIREISQALEEMSVVEGLEDSKSQKSGSAVWEYEVEPVKSDGEEDEDSYVEDSFLIKDTESEGDNTSSGFECDELSAIGELPSPSIPLRIRSAKYAESTPLRVKPQFSTTVKSEKTQKSILDSIDDEESRRLLVELYPELSNTATASESRASHWKGSEVSSGDSEEKSGGEKEDDDDEEEDGRYERFLKEMKGDQSANEADEVDRYDDDLDNFIVDDDEPLLYDDGTPEGEEESDKEEISITDVIPRHLFVRRPLKKPQPCEDKENKNGLVEWIPPHEKAKVRKGLIKLFTEGTPLKEVLNQSINEPNAKEAKEKKRMDDDERFLMALSPNGPKHPVATNFINSKFARIRDDLTKKLFDIYRRRCFEGKLHEEMKVEWNARLRLTAGRCRCMRNGTAIIELSTKVCNSPERVRDTLIHEMCHAAVWVIDRIQNGGHGPAWKYWVMRCLSVFNSLPPIMRCHNYKIDVKFLYVCNGCGQTVKRHTKSLDTDRKMCAICRGRFELQRTDGKNVSSNKRINKFAEFVKYNYGEVKKPGMKHADVMKILSQRFKEQSEKKAEIAN